MAILYQDAFTYANGNLSANAGWTDVAVGGSLMAVNTSQATVNNAGADAFCRYTAVSSSTDHLYVQATTTASVSTGGVGVGLGVCLCVDSGGAQTYIRFITSLAGYELGRFNAGAFTSLSSGSGTTFTAGDKFRLEYTKSTGAWALYKFTGTSPGAAFATGTDPAPLSGTQSGVGYSSAGTTACSIDNFELGDFTTSISGFAIPLVRPSIPGSPGYTAWITRRQPYNTVVVAGDVTLALTGVQATGQVGTLTPNNSVPLTGVAGTGSVGTVVPNDSIGLTGVAGSGSVGTLIPNDTIGITGVSGTGSVGNVGPGDAQGLTGVQATGAVGTLVPNTVIGLTGVQGTGQVGTVSTGSDVTASLTGVAGTGSVGTLTPNTSVALTGVTGAGSVGTVTPNDSIGLTGVAGTGSVGTLSPATTVGLTGVVGTGSVGSVSIAGDVTTGITGVVGTGQVGNVTPSPSTSSGGEGMKRRSFNLGRSKKEYEALQAAFEELAAEVTPIEAQSAAELTAEARKQLARNAAIVTKKYAKAAKLAEIYQTDLSGIDAALAFIKARMAFLLEEEIMFVIALIVGMDDDA